MARLGSGRTTTRITTAPSCLIPTGTTSRPCAARRRERDLQLQLLLALPERAQPQRVEPDEAGGVALVVGNRTFLEGDEILIVERIRALAPDHADASLVELEPHIAGHVGLRLVDRSLQHLALGREPEPVVDQLGVFRHQLVFEMRGAAVERDLLDAAM